MRIKRLEVIGFKSFCDKTIVHFNEPITGVVGPNGCGKSNIVDAIRWCMGEQSAKHLRGKAMDDVIFAGSESRGPLGMCEVTLVFENDGQVPIEYLAYSEIAVTRKLFRDGTSEYFLNKTPCRLRDITDFFLGTGVGAKAYSIIEQGRVGMIVSSKPEDRRFLIEEAAGITKYKVKKKAAEKKMDGTRQNLLRVTDVVAEIEKQLASLRRQAQKAERYRQYKAELRDLDLWSASQRWLGFTVETSFVEGRRVEVAAAVEQAETQLISREAEVESARLVAVSDEQQLSEMQTALFELDNRIRLGESEADHQARSAIQLDERAADADQELVQLATRAEEDARARGEAETALKDAEEAVANQAGTLAAREDRLREARTLLANVQRAVDEGRAQLGHHKAEIAGGEGAERAAARRRDDNALRVARLGEEDSRLKTRGDELAGDVSAVDERLGGLRQLKLDLVAEKTRAEERVAELKAALTVSQPKLDALTAELNKKRSRRASLVELHARYEGFASGTRAVLADKDKDGRWGIIGPLADVVEAPADLEGAVEAVLAERLGAVLVETQEVGIDAIEQLKAKSAGRATFVPLNRMNTVAERRELPEGARGWLVDSLSAAEEHKALLGHLFGDVIVVDDVLTALDLWRAGARHTYVTPTGEVVHADGVLVGGSAEAAAAGVMAQKREIRELDGVVGELETEHAQLEAVCTRDREELTALRTTLEALQKDAHQREVELLTHDKDAQRLRDELERVNTRLHALAGEQQEIQALVAEAAREAEEATLAVRAARDLLLSTEDKLSQLAGDQVARLDEVEQAQEAVTELRIGHAQAEEKRRSLRATLDRLDNDERERAARREKLTTSSAEDRTEAESLRGMVAARREELTALASEHARAAEELQVARSAYEARRSELAEVETVIRGMRSELDAHHKTLSQLDLKLHDLASGRVHLEETIAERYRIELHTVACEHHLRALAGEDEDKRARELRELIERMGEINLNAIEEYNTLETRYTFLCSQKEDLEKALAQLEEAIDRINKTSKKRFQEVFDMVNAKFQEIFPRCFRGGQARLVLTDPENLLESGIEIIAQPPGKKNATVELLSGGEKAMTAVALIFSIFLIKPSPFCLLDEVDAPLDEANVGRFNDLIRELTDRSQFIVITHNKRTMQIADTLYGVTMEEPGISKLVSVNLGQIGRDGNFSQRNATRAA
jgi:chromosome segregation protein